MTTFDTRGARSMLSRPILNGQIQTLYLSTGSLGPNVETVDWLTATQGGTTFDPGSSGIQGGLRVLDFGLPAFQASLFADIRLGGGDDGDAADLELDLNGLFTFLGCNGIVAGAGMPIGHAGVLNDGVTTSALHVVEADSGIVVLLKGDGTRFDDPIVSGVGVVSLQLDCQITND